ncbi:hypothetical protein [Bradyrhizobium sp. STM 3557]|uniref:hypothetical protein n=1 Tax=Bradyrhizobium sp. STM 3557 TaxID=578920 RepID=UPI003890B2DE
MSAPAIFKRRLRDPVTVSGGSKSVKVPTEFSRLFVNCFTEDRGISVHADVTGWQPISGWRRANFNIRGWQGRWRHTAPTALFFLPRFPLSAFRDTRIYSALIDQKFWSGGDLRLQRILC